MDKGKLIKNLSSKANNIKESAGTGATVLKNQFQSTRETISNNLPNGVQNITEEGVMTTLDWAYQQTINGIPGQKSIDDLVDDYLSKYDKETAIEKLIQFQTTKAAASGFLSNIGGIATIPVTLPANITSVILFQMRMIAAIAKIRGYDLKDDQVQTFVYATLAGTTITEIVKKGGITFGNKFALSMVNRIPGTVLTKINQAVGFRFVTKMGTTGIVNMGKMVPLVGGVIGGAVDTKTTLTIAKVAKQTFEEVGLNLGDGTIIDIKDKESIESIEDYI